jgi:Uma2 family endonuclease
MRMKNNGLGGTLVQMALTAPERPLTADEYMQMVEAGVFGPDDHIELLDGEIVEMSPQGKAHIKACTRTCEALVLAYASSDHEVRPMATHRAGPRSVPEPDFSVVARSENDVVEVAKSLLLVEVADSSLKIDRGWKASIYARAGAPLYWIVEIPYRRVRVFSDPVDGEYRTESVVDESGALALPATTHPIAISSLLHPAG